MTSEDDLCIAMSSSNVQSVADRAQSSQNGSLVDHSEEVGRGWGARPGTVVHWAGADHVPRSALALRWPSPPAPAVILQYALLSAPGGGEERTRDPPMPPRLGDRCRG